MEFRNAVFIVTEEHSCPVYNVGKEFIVYDSSLSINGDKEVCLRLMQELLKILANTTLLDQIILPEVLRSKFECAGCSGLIRFEYKKKKAFSTLQMNLLKAAEERIKQQQPVVQMNLPKVTEQPAAKRHFKKLFGLLRAIKLFEPLNDTDLQGLALMMKLEKYAANKLIIKEG
ncbi:MAG: hypothetical protein D3923_16970, partial [Candidatus Electrothrix sp. AR3]|nr:hypothetical protein [Candidatus Electrothrix sp. AR3]